MPEDTSQANMTPPEGGGVVTWNRIPTGRPKRVVRWASFHPPADGPAWLEIRFQLAWPDQIGLFAHAGPGGGPVSAPVNVSTRGSPFGSRGDGGPGVVTVTAAVSLAPEAVSVARTVTAPDGTEPGAV